MRTWIEEQPKDSKPELREEAAHMMSSFPKATYTECLMCNEIQKSHFEIKNIAFL